MSLYTTFFYTTYEAEYLEVKLVESHFNQVL